jgi:hypothetical protein
MRVAVLAIQVAVAALEVVEPILVSLVVETMELQTQAAAVLETMAQAVAASSSFVIQTHSSILQVLILQ